MFSFKFSSPNSDSHEKIKIIINTDLYSVKLSLCLENSPIIHKLYSSSKNKSELSLDISNESQQFKIIANLFNGKKIFFNSYNVDYIEYVANNLEITSLLNEIMKYRAYISASEFDNILVKLSEIDSALFNLNITNFDKTSSLELFNDLSKEEVSLITHIIFRICSIYTSKASILFDLLAELNHKNKFYVESFISQLYKFIDFKIIKFVLHNLLSRNLITDEEFENQQSKFRDDYVFYDFSFNQSNGNNNDSNTCELDNNIEAIQEGVNTSEIATAIRNDDIDLLQQLSAEEKFNFNQNIPSNYYECSPLLIDITLLQYSAAYGSVKCFKFLLINGAEIDNQLTKYAILGGSPEILRICEQNKCNFESSLNDSILFHRSVFFDWILDTKFKIESSTDVCSYAFFQRDYILQRFFHCKQCKLTGNLGCCHVCAKKCHNDHDGMKFGRLTNCFCDCGDSGFCHCMPSSDSDSSYDEEEEVEIVDDNSNSNSNDSATNSDSNNNYDSNESSYNDENEEKNNENNQYDIKNLYEKYSNLNDDVDEEEEDDEYKSQKMKRKEENENDNDDQNQVKNNNNKKIKKIKRKKAHKHENTKKYVSSGDLVIECYSNLNFVCLKKLIDMGVNIIKSLDPPLLVEATKCNDLLFVKYLLKFPEIDVNNTETINEYNNPLLISCENEFTEIFEVLLENPEIDVNAASNTGSTPLHIAVSKNNIHMVKRLLDNPKILINKPNLDGETPIFLSCMKGNYEIFKLLFRRSDIDIRISCGKKLNSIFLAACRSGSLNIIRDLIEYQVKEEGNETQNSNNNDNSNLDRIENAKDSINTENSTTSTDNTTHKNNATNKDSNNDKVNFATTSNNENLNNTKEIGASNEISNDISGDLNSILSVRRNSIDKMIQETDKLGNNALHLACRSGNVDLIKLLLSTNLFDINSSNNQHFTPLRLACISRNIEAIKLIIHHPDIDLSSYSRYKQTPLHYACNNNFHELTEYLLKNHIYDVNISDYEKKTALHYACENGDQKNVALLLKEQNIDVNPINVNGETPLHLASKCCSKEVVETLLNDSRVMRNLTNLEGQTPIVYSIVYGYGSVECFKLLVNDDLVDVRVKDKSNATVLYYAAGYCEEAVHLLIDRCIDQINEKTEDGMTPLHNACMIGDIDIVKILLKVPGILVDEKNNNGFTPYGITLNPEIQTLIQNFKNDHNS